MNATITGAVYNNVTNTLTLTGTDFSGATFDATKATWDVNSDDLTTLNYVFPEAAAAGTIGSVTTVVSDTTATILLRPDSAAGLETTTGFAGSVEDELDLSADLVTDVAGNTSGATTLKVALHLTGTDNADNMFGGQLDDILIGGLGNDILTGRNGADVLWGGAGADTMIGDGSTNPADDDAADQFIIVGDLAGVGQAKIELINTTLEGLLGYNPGLDETYTTDIAAGETLTFSNTGNDTLHVFGTVDLTGVTITGNYNVVTYSELTMTQAQLDATNTIELVDNGDANSKHTLIITDGAGTPLSVNDQIDAFNLFLSRAGTQLRFDETPVTTTKPLIVGGTVANGAREYEFSAPLAAQDINNQTGRDQTSENIAAPVTLGAMPQGNPVGASPSSSGLVYDDASNGNSGNMTLVTTTSVDPVTINRQHFVISAGDRFKGAEFISNFEPGTTNIPVPDTFSAYGDDKVHNNQFEVYYGNYDIRTDVFTVTGGGRTTGYGEYTLILYDNDPTSNVEFVEGLIFANSLPETNRWSIDAPRTPQAEMKFTSAATVQEPSTFGDAQNNTINASNGGVEYLYGMAGDDILTGGTGDFLFAGIGADIVNSGDGQNIIDLGDSAFDGTRGDQSADVVVIEAVAGTSSDSELVAAVGGGNATGEDFVFHFELATDTIKIVATNIENFNHGGAQVVDTVTNTVNIGDSRTVLTTTLTVDLDGNGIGAGDVAVSFQDWQIADPAKAFNERIQYQLTGTGNANVITGGDLDDTIDGGAGADQLSGGAGNDRIIADNADTLISGGAGTDTMVLAASASFTAAEINTVENVELASGVELTLDYSDVTGQDNVSAVTGVNGGATEKLIVIGKGAGQGPAVLDFSASNITLTDVLLEVQGGSAVETITGTTSADIIRGGAGADALTGGAGSDTYVYTGTVDVNAAETITEGAGDGTADRLRVDGTTDFSVMAAANFDEIEELEITGAFTATFTGAQLTGEALTLYGDGNSTQAVIVTATAGGTTDLSNISGDASWTDGTDTVTINGADGSAETIKGSQLSDIINGGSGDDIITGGTGADTITGGTGADKFVYTATTDTATANVIADMDVLDGFETASDVIDLTALAPVTNLTVVADPNGSGDDYVLSWTSGTNPNTVTNYVYLKDTGVTGGLAALDDGTGLITVGTSTPLTLTLNSISSDGISVTGSGPYRAYFTDTSPVNNQANTWFMNSGNVGANTPYTFETVPVNNSESLTVEGANKTGFLTIESTRSGVETTLDAIVWTGTDNGDDVIVADLNTNLPGGGGNAPDYAIIYGFGGNDQLTGTSGNDVIIGGAGNDAMSGGAGNDTFIVEAGVDTISDLGGTSANAGDPMEVDVLKVSGGTVNVTVTDDWTASAATANTGGTVTLTLEALDAAHIADWDGTNLTGIPDGVDIDLRLATGTGGYTIDARATPDATFTFDHDNDPNTADITLRSGNDIYGSANADIIYTGPQFALVDAGGGNDVLNLNAGANANAVIMYSTGDGSDVVNDFTTGVDEFRMDFNPTSANTAWVTFDGTNVNGSTFGAGLIGGSSVLYFSGNLNVGETPNSNQLFVALETLLPNAEPVPNGSFFGAGAGQDNLFVLNDTATGNSYVIEHDDFTGGDNTLHLSELRLVATFVDTNLAQGDILDHAGNAI